MIEKVLVIGSHGKVGQLLVSNLVDLKFKVYAMIRNENQVAEMTDLGAHVVMGDLESDFTSLFEGMDAVVFTAGSGSKTGPDKTISVDQDAAISTIDLAETLGMERYIMVSAQGAREPEEMSKIQHYYEAKAVADNRLINSDLNYTIFRPGRLIDERGNGKVDISENHLERSSTSRENLAKAIAFSLNLPNTYQKVLEIIEGPTEIERALKQI